jgi:hypothetical protein
MKKILLTSFIATAVIFIAVDANAQMARNNVRHFNRNHYTTSYNNYQDNERNENYRRHVITYEEPGTGYNQPYYAGSYYDKDDYRYNCNYRNLNNKRRYISNDRRYGRHYGEEFRW